MKQVFAIILSASLFLAACKKDNLTSTTPGTDMPDPNSTVLLMGNFIAGPFGAPTGQAEIRRAVNGSLTLVLKNFTVNNGPDLHVYLSKEVQPINFIDLGRLKSISGTQVYTINGTPDFTQYRYALIHCQQFNHLFGSAELKQ
ncbi:DM13 domain-containing protein [Lacibacter sp. MH-610]|uniref:DM13 domain-containing protein n=1 Tax=Lacibacter sp. MH-610 TaxID=3020883 RepID=UPI0038913522